jgi:hypothetical protein
VEHSSPLEALIVLTTNLAHMTYLQAMWPVMEAQCCYVRVAPDAQTVNSLGSGFDSWAGFYHFTILLFVTTSKYTKESNPCTGLDRALRIQKVEGTRISRQSAQGSGKVVSPTYRPPLTPGDVPGTHFCYMMNLPQDHSAARRIKSMKNPKDPIGLNQTSLRQMDSLQV